MARTFLLLILASFSQAIRGPEQIHIAYGYDASEMCIMWSTDVASTTILHYQDAAAATAWTNVSGESWKFTEGNPSGLQYIHRVNLTVFEREGLRI